MHRDPRKTYGLRIGTVHANGVSTAFRSMRAVERQKRAGVQISGLPPDALQKGAPVGQAARRVD